MQLLRRRNVFALLLIVLIILTLVFFSFRNQAAIKAPIFPSQPPQYPMYDLTSVNNEIGWNISNTHDPSIFKDGDTYYVFSTDIKVKENLSPLKPGIMVRKSKDLIHWDWEGYALDGVPQEAFKWTGADRLWAPDVTKIKDTYFLYYAASKFGTNQSFIGLATSKSILGPWVDQGEVFKTTSGSPSNAIDPNIVKDKDGNLWMVYGSFFGGIYIVQLDQNTGKLKQYGEGELLARRDSATTQGAVEAPYIIYQPELKKYYMFVSYDSLFVDYNVRVGMSDHITGPYLDQQGHNMADTSIIPAAEVGNKILGSYRFSNADGWVAPGHNSVLQDGGNSYIIHHARGEMDTKWAYLHVRKLVWTENGWPVVSPERFAGEVEQPIPKSMIAGYWERIVFDKLEASRASSEDISLLENGQIQSDLGKGKWILTKGNHLNLIWEVNDKNLSKSLDDQVVVIPAWDWENNHPTLIFTGLNEQGIAIWGKRRDKAL